MLQREHSAILLTFIKVPFVIKTFVLSIFEWPFYADLMYVLIPWYITGTVYQLLVRKPEQEKVRTLPYST